MSNDTSDQSLRILARIIARKRLKEFAGNSEDEPSQSSPDALPTSSTTVLQRGKKRKYMVDIGQWPAKVKRPGRPRAIPKNLEVVVVELFRRGYGYCAIARILRNDHGLNPHYSSVRKTLIRLGEVRRG